MEFRILGPLEVLAEGEPVALGGSKQRALLAVLVLHPGETLTADRLIDELWGEEPPATAAKALQVHISRLRKALAAAGPAEVIATRENGYALAVAREAVDAFQFETLLADARRAREGSRSRRAAELLEEALGLWRGEALVDLAYEPFAQREAARLEDLRLGGVEDLIDAKLALGRHTEVIGQLEQLIADNPYRERLRAQLMLALYRADRQADALQAFQQARRVLVDELGIEPGERLRALEHAILGHEPGLGLPAVAESDEPPTGGAPSRRHPLVGRAPEMKVLTGALDDALAGSGALVLLAGEPGIGKSRLLEELEDRARDRGARVLWGRCWEAGGAPPYWPWLQIIPALRDVFASLAEAPTVDAETARFRLFEAAGDLLAAAADEGPLVLLLEDLHSADDPSLLLLRFVAGQLGTSPVLIAGSYRDVEVEPDTPLASLVAGLARESVTRSLTLTGLTHADVAELVEANTGGRPPEGSVTAIHRSTEGNPFFVGEVVQLLASEGRLEAVDASAKDALPIPPGVREVIGQRLRRLPAECRATLSLAAVLGREFAFDPLVQVTGGPEDAVLDALEQALRARVLVEVPGNPDRLRFAHELIRDTLYGDLAAPRRLRLHRAVGEALEELYGDDRESHLAELAHHFAAARTTSDSAKAVAYARAAGDRALALFAYEEAVRLYALALDSLPADRKESERTRCELLLARAGALARAGDTPAAKSGYERTAELAKSAGFPDLFGRAALGYGGRFVWLRAATDARLVPLLEDALTALGEDDSTLRVRLLARLGAALRSDASRERRARMRDEAVEAARRIGDEATLAYALTGGIAALHGPDNYAEQLDEATEVIALGERIGDREREFEGREHAFWIAWSLGDVGRRADEVVALRQVADELEQPAHMWLATAVAASVALADGRFETAEELIERAETLGRRAVAWSAQSTRKLQRFVLYRHHDRLSEIEAEVRDHPDDFASPLLHRSTLAYIHAATGGEATAAAVLDEIFTHDLEHWHVDEEWLFSLSLLAETCVLLGDMERGAPLYELLLPRAASNAVAFGEVGLDAVARPLGLLAMSLDRPGEAAEHFERAIALNERMGARPWVAHSRQAYARLLSQQSDPESLARATELARSAEAEFRALGMAAHAREAGRLLAPA